MQNFSRHIQSLLNDPSTIAFLKAARQYMALMENGKVIEEEFFREIIKILSQLYSAGLSLKDIPLKYSNANTEFHIPEEEILKIPANILSFIGSLYYNEIFNPTQLNSEPVTGCLYDDLTDIYKDLKRAFYLLDHIGTDKAVEEALWQLNFSFKHHWGDHAIDALRYLHYKIKQLD